MTYTTDDKTKQDLQNQGNQTGSQSQDVNKTGQKGGSATQQTPDTQSEENTDVDTPLSNDADDTLDN